MIFFVNKYHIFDSLTIRVICYKANNFSRPSKCLRNSMLRRGAERDRLCLPEFFPRLVLISRGPHAEQAHAWPPAPPEYFINYAWLIRSLSKCLGYYFLRQSCWGIFCYVSISFLNSSISNTRYTSKIFTSTVRENAFGVLCFAEARSGIICACRSSSRALF